MPIHPLNFLRAGAVIGVFACFAACHEDPVRQPMNTGLTLGGDVYRILCKRVASGEHPGDMTGVQFNDRCEGKAAPTAMDSPKLKAMLEVREPMVDALDLALGVVDPAQPTPGMFDEGELQKLLELMVPLYDPPAETLPKATRAAAEVLRTWLDQANPKSNAAIAALSELSGREGYRPLSRALGPIRTLLAYERLDDVTLSTLKLLDEGGPANEPFVDSLTALGLELAVLGDDDDPNETGPTNIELAVDLLTSTDAALASGNGPIPVLKRDARGLPVPVAGMGMDADGDGLAEQDPATGRLLGSGGSALPTPFAIAKQATPGIPADTATARDGNGLALTAAAAEGGQPVYETWDMDQSLLAAILRDTGTLVERPADGERSAGENLTRGLRVLLGPPARQQEIINSRTIDYEGMDPRNSPLLELMHAVGTLLTFEEVTQFLKAARELLATNENALAQLGYVALKLDEISDDPEYAGAQLMGQTATGEFSPDAPHDFWDDLIQVVRDIDKRGDMLGDVLRSLADPRGPANTKLIANWMRHNNVVVYGDAPEDERPVSHPADRELLLQNTINNPATVLADTNIVGSDNVEVMSDNVDEMKVAYDSNPDPNMPNRGWNRSIWQRTLSLIHGLNGVRVCNKDNAYLKSTALVDLGLSPAAGEGPYAECDFIDIQDAVQQYNQALLGEAVIIFQPSDSADWVNTWAGLGSSLGISGTVGEEQEKDSGIYGFTDKPTPSSLARFIFAPRNEFLNLLFDPLQTNDGVAINEWEPYALFPMEIVDPVAVPADGSAPNGMSFEMASEPLVRAFEDNELTDDNGMLTDGYMFGRMLSAVHMHWGAPGLTGCTEADWGCTQSLDPAAPFFAHGTNVQSYEPLIARALLDEGLADALYDNIIALRDITVDGKDGITLLTELVQALVRPRENATYRDESITTSLTNTGKEIGDIPPIYLVFDALKKADEAWAKEENAERHEAWLSARSELVDLFLGASKIDDGSGNVTYQMTNRNVPPVGTILIDWLLDRVEDHRAKGDLETWGPELATDLQDILVHPATAAGLDLLDVFWDDATASTEVANLLTYMLADPDQQTFAATVETVLHALQFLRDEDRAEALAHGLSLLLEPTAQSTNASEPPKAAESASMRGISAVVAVAELEERRPTTINKILRNVVEPLAVDGRSPLEVFIDGVFQLHRMDPTKSAYGAFDQQDVRSILTEAADFLDDEEHGLERLTRVIQGRSLSDGDDTMTTTTGTMTGMTGLTAGTSGMAGDGGTATSGGGTTGTTGGATTSTGTTTGTTAGTTTTGGTAGTTTTGGMTDAGTDAAADGGSDAAADSGADAGTDGG